MSLGLGYALLEDARELLKEDEEQKKLQEQQRLAQRRGSVISDIDTSIKTPLAQRRARSNSEDSTTAIEPVSSTNDTSTSTTPMTPRPPVETAESFAHRRKMSQETRTRSTAMSSVYGRSRSHGNASDSSPGSAKHLPGDLGPNDPRRAPSPAMGSKSQSPHSRRLQDRSSPKMTRPRRASDGALLRPKKRRQDSDEVQTRLPTDKNSGSSSSDDGSADSDDERGRGRDRLSRSNSAVEDSEDEMTHSRGNFSPSGTPYSPSITVTPPGAGGDGHGKKQSVHPHSAYDHSAHSTPRHSDDEEQMSDFRRAQRLKLTMSPIHSTPSAHRVIRQILRGDYTHFQREAEKGRRRQRVYLVATDLSPEAEYALEWTIGTVLRDGDTLLALYAVDEESGTGAGEGVEIGHGALVVKDTASIVGSLASEKIAHSPARSPLPWRRDGSRSRPPQQQQQPLPPTSGDPAEKSRAERERSKAAEDISQRVVKLLRKTRLQVRVVVEVFHCKSPRHMITEVIDFLSPTMAILGSRGRSALKGVLLGSFSNYIVTKSSVPVMVARRRLRKHAKQQLHKDGLPVAGTGDGRMHVGRMSNVLEAPASGGRRINRLSVAKVD